MPSAAFTLSCSRMLKLEHIALYQFKNYPNRDFRFSNRITGICGRNGSGKTNLLDAIHYLCFTKSYFTRTDSNSVLQGASGFRIEGNFLTGELPEKAVCILRENGRKEFTINGEQYDKFSRHIGRYPCVVIAPDDVELITGDSKTRRGFLDELLSQLDAGYLQQLIVYTRILQQRNALLKQLAEQQSRDYALLDILDAQLIPAGDYIFNRRRDFLLSFLPAVTVLYHEIASISGIQYSPEPVQLLYESELFNGNFSDLLHYSRQKDLAAQRSLTGIHRDELDIRFGDRPFRSIASQGQRKSLLFALKLAEMNRIRQDKKMAPLLLLDDVFEKLDEDRMANLLQKVCTANDGQVFITDTDADRLRVQLEKIGVAGEFEALKI